MLCWPPKPVILGPHLPGVGTMGWGVWCGAQTPYSLERTSIIVMSSCCGPPTQGCGSRLYHVFIPPTHLMWFLLYIFSCRKCFLLVYRLFWLIIALKMVVILVCLWEELSSGSSYSITMVISLKILMSDNAKCWWRCGAISIALHGDAKSCSHFGKEFGCVSLTYVYHVAQQLNSLLLTQE